MAATIQDELGLSVTLEEGGRGEFTLWVDGEVVAKKSMHGFPDPAECVAAVRARLAASRA